MGVFTNSFANSLFQLGANLNQEIDLVKELGDKLLLYGKDSTDTDNIVVSGSEITQWTDASGNDRHLIKVTGKDGASINDEGALFDGVNDALRATIPLTDFEVYFIFSQVITSENDRIIDFGGEFVVQQRPSTDFEYRVYSYVSAQLKTFQSDGRPEIFKGIIDGANSIINDEAYDVGAIDVSRITLAMDNALGNIANIIHREIVITSPLTTDERDKVLERLNNLLPDASNYELGDFKVIDDTYLTYLAANTGLCYDKNREEIISAVSCVAASEFQPDIRVFNEDYERQTDLTFNAYQGLAYDPDNDRFFVWLKDNNGLDIVDRDGTFVSNQVFDPYGDGTSAGTIAYNYNDDEIAACVDGGNDIIIYSYNGATEEYEYDRTLGVSDVEEGVCYDEDDDCYWYRTLNHIKKVTKTGGTILKTLPQPTKTQGTNEGMAYNPNKKTIYLNADKYYHGSVADGNRCVEVDPYY